MRTVDVEYTYDDLLLIGELSVDDDRPGPRPAVLVCHEGDGMSEHSRNKARRLAELGYVAFALDYHGGGRKLAGDEAGKAFARLSADPDRVRALGQAGLDILLAHEQTDPARVAAIGFCFGGTMALELARGGADLKAVVGFHSGLSTSRPQDATNITGRILVCIGTEDPIIPPEQRLAFEQEMRDGGVDWRMNLYGGAAHSFTNPAADGSRMPAIKYDQRADERSWRAMTDLFDEVF
ncbi:dienelactone hydrolase family protein [Frankia sp. AgB1.9]|uniref:dienelactone hydrolase family protein n=1 Tax=unclassified Frankia TaxID=2632575 RepID=UPI0019329C78|nr:MULTISPECIES: dienelactone hydrolase family protein [unclassified Frankia]MBL7488765.1 dienelactone hydrolase family protein [Frankia sp. AgW1.1]MBL7546554.1 dienelactone hydrolase family protein [Frankia sp. AgB1.9]MBL7625076.1 dienelactone hydrolase family protein [Frankia sp. AgB1.8]